MDSLWTKSELLAMIEAQENQHAKLDTFAVSESFRQANDHKQWYRDRIVALKSVIYYQKQLIKLLTKEEIN